MFTFYWPWMILLMPLPLISYYFLPGNKSNNSNTSPEILFPHIARLSLAFTNKRIGSNKSKKWFIILLSLLWISLVLALMRPGIIDTGEISDREGYDIMLAVDISGSMEALDFSTKLKKISRLDVVKNVVSKFINDRKGDRVGLILFGEFAYLQMPITFDIESVSHMLNNAITGMAGPSTAIGDAIGVAAREIRGRSQESRVIILLTDGTDNASNIPPLEAARIAKHYGIRIYTIGIGTNIDSDGKSKKVPYPNSDGTITMTEIIMDEALLANIAEITSGQYFKATDNAALEKIYSKINELEKTKIDTTEYKIRHSLYKYPLGFACLLFLMLCLLPLKPVIARNHEV